MIDKVGKKCCGCSACASICPKHCIKMVLNHEGFPYPQIQEENCVKCGICEKVCPVLMGKVSAEDGKRQAWAVINQDRNVLMNSSSGGLFTALADVVIDRGGCVFGAAFTADFSRVHHIMTDNAEELGALRGSKYMQSDMEDCYRKVRKQLLLDRWVLFTGTPCQIAGLKGYLGRDHDRLVCVDIVCHGTPSSLLWQHYLKDIERKLGDTVTAVSFREKTDGWKKYGLNATAEGGKIYHSPMQKDSYMRMFLKNVCLRESCYHCSAKEKGFFSDITMGDFWGVEQILPEIDSSLGVSLALPHTEKGRLLFEQAGGSMRVIFADYERAVSHNPSLISSSGRPCERDDFFSDLDALSWNKMERRYAKDNLCIVVRRKISASPIGVMKRKLCKRSI